MRLGSQTNEICVSSFRALCARLQPEVAAWPESHPSTGCVCDISLL
eukprot:COSAG02_NODE_11842_length_1643_cov_2.961788_2_plen_45_part_01